MKRYLPTYEECLQMCESKGDMVFYEIKHKIDGYDVSLFNYRFPIFTDFVKPVESNENIQDAFELRGLCFVFNEDGTLFNRFLMLHKFFNLDQVEITQYDKVKDLPIKSVYNKEDGSLSTFIKLPNGRILGKTKMGFDNDQTKNINKIYNKNEAIKTFVDDCLVQDFVPMFEYVSWDNKIVLDYNEPELILLRVRDNKTGEYVNVEDFRGLGFRVVESEKITLSDMMKLAETTEDKEGWVTEFENGLFMKLKTEWYFLTHNLNDETSHEHVIIGHILNDNIDDVVSKLDTSKQPEKLDFIDAIDKVVKRYMSRRKVEIEELITKFNGDFKDFAINYLNDKSFHIAIGVLRGSDIYEKIKEETLSKTNKLMKARDFLQENNK